MPIGNALFTELRQTGFAKLSSEDVTSGLSAPARQELSSVVGTFEELVEDQHMADGGTYRYRRFSRFRVDRMGTSFQFTPIHGNSIYQERKDNPLNGGVTRSFEPLSSSLSEGQFLRSLLKFDTELVAEYEPDFFTQPTVIGVHQVRIVAAEGQPGKPTPEGVHRDAERYTFQHFWSRDGIDGGAFLAYDAQKKERFRWLQQNRLDSVIFLGTSWHSATPIACRAGVDRGHRDIFLVDFDRL